jgi:hypothetical protein
MGFGLWSLVFGLRTLSSVSRGARLLTQKPSPKTKAKGHSFRLLIDRHFCTIVSTLPKKQISSGVLTHAKDQSGYLPVYLLGLRSWAGHE